MDTGATAVSSNVHEVPFEWTKRLTLRLISELKKHPCLWSVRQASLRDGNERSQAHSDIFHSLKVIDRKCTLVAVKKKISALRTQYKQAFEASFSVSGDGTGPFHKPKLWCFNELNFLSDRVRGVRESTSPLGSAGQVMSRNPRKSASSSATSTSLEDHPKQSKVSPTLKDDSAFLTGQLVEKELREMEDQQRNIARKLVSDVMFYGTANRLHATSYVALLNDPDLLLQRDPDFLLQRDPALNRHEWVPVASSSGQGSASYGTGDDY